MNSNLEKCVLMKSALNLSPPLIAADLLKNICFRGEYEKIKDVVVTFGNSGESFARNELFDAVRGLYTDGSVREVPDKSGKQWTLMMKEKSGELPIVEMSSEGVAFILPYSPMFSVLSTHRTLCLDEISTEYNFPSSIEQKWYEIVSVRRLDNDEFDYLIDDIEIMPVSFIRGLRQSIESGEADVSTLVPSSRVYFEMLVGEYDASDSIKDYAANAGGKFIDQQMLSRPIEGLLSSLLLSSHASLTDVICVKSLSTDQLVEVYKLIDRHGDPLSRLGAVELGLRILHERPEIEGLILRLVSHIRDEEVEDKKSEFKLFCSLFIMVDGELARRSLFNDTPPFYRRLVSLAHAALIHREVMSHDIEYDRLVIWAKGQRVEQFYSQIFADMRVEPRWNPNFADPAQFQADFFGRLILAAKSHERNIADSLLHDAILGEASNSVLNLSKFPYQFFPGPLEGERLNSNPLPGDLADSIQEQLDVDDIEAASFIALVNSATLFRISSGEAELAANALKLGNHTLINLEDKSQLITLLQGLASVAAVTQSLILADSLLLLVRRFRHDTEYVISAVEEFEICLVASASREDLIEWCEFCGAWLTEISFEPFEEGDEHVFSSLLTNLLHSVPELWYSCARAKACLDAICDK